MFSQIRYQSVFAEVTTRLQQLILRLLVDVKAPGDVKDKSCAGIFSKRFHGATLQQKSGNNDDFNMNVFTLENDTFAHPFTGMFILSVLQLPQKPSIG